jgi:hypothetical protein
MAAEVSGVLGGKPSKVSRAGLDGKASEAPEASGAGPDGKPSEVAEAGVPLPHTSLATQTLFRPLQIVPIPF